MIFIFTYEQIRNAVEQSKTYYETVRLLGLPYHKSGLITLGNLIAEHNIDASHLSRRTDYTKDQLALTIKASVSFCEVARKLGKNQKYGQFIKFDAQRWHIDISHFTGREHLRIRKSTSLNKKIPLDLVLTNQVPMKSEHLKERLFAEGLKQRECERCHRVEHNGELIPLELNHKDGDHFNNSCDNIEILDPNCHSLTPTFAGRNRKFKCTDEIFSRAVEQTACFNQVAANLGLSGISKNQKTDFLERIDKLNLSTNHWRTTDQMVRVQDPWNKRPLLELLIENLNVKSGDLKERLFKEGIKERKCEICGITKWEGEKLSFSLDHINGKHTDNRLENLRILCFICHARTPTYKGKNIGKNPTIKKIVKKTDQNHPKQPRPLCHFCGKNPVLRKRNKFCSIKCMGLSKQVRPSKEELARLLLDHSKIEISKMFNVSPASITHWTQEYSL